MTKYKSQGFKNTFRNAQKGLRIVLKTELNIRIHCITAILVLLFAYFLNCSVTEICMLLFAIAIVIVSEMLNTAIEFTLDSVFHNHYSKMVGMAKDISAGAVMFATFISICIGILIFGKHLLA